MLVCRRASSASTCGGRVRTELFVGARSDDRRVGPGLRMRRRNCQCVVGCQRGRRALRWPPLDSTQMMPKTRAVNVLRCPRATSWCSAATCNLGTRGELSLDRACTLRAVQRAHQTPAADGLRSLPRIKEKENTRCGATELDWCVRET